MSRFRKLSHAKWHCQYHILWTPKYRLRILTGQVANELNRCIRAFSEQKDCEVIELSIQFDHVHMIILVPLKISISDFVGVVKGRTAIRILNNIVFKKKFGFIRFYLKLPKTNAKLISMLFNGISHLGNPKILKSFIFTFLLKSIVARRKCEFAGTFTGDKSIAADTVFDDWVISKSPKSNSSIRIFLLDAFTLGASYTTTDGMLNVCLIVLKDASN